MSPGELVRWSLLLFFCWSPEVLAQGRAFQVHGFDRPLLAISSYPLGWTVMGGTAFFSAWS